MLSTLQGVAQNAFDYSDVDKALNFEDPNAALFYLGHSPIREAESRVRFAEILFLQRNYSSAEFIIDSLLDVKTTSTVRAYACWYKARLYYHRAETESGLEMAAQGKKAVSGSKSPPVRITAGLLLVKGLLLTDEQSFEESEKEIQEALALYKQDSTGYYIRISSCHYGLGILYWTKREPEKAEQQLLACKKILQNNPLDKQSDLARVLNLLGNIYGDEGRYQSAKENYSKAVDISLRVEKDSMHIAVPLINFGAFFLNYGNFVESEQYFLRGLKYVNTENPYHIPYAAKFYLTTGKLYYEMGQPYKALGYLNTSRSLYLKMANHDPTFPECLLALSTVTCFVDDLESATLYLDEAEQEMSSLKNVDPGMRARYLIDRSNVVGKRDRKAVLPLLEQAREILDNENSGYYEVRGDLHFHIGLNEQMQGQYEQAFKDLKTASEIYSEQGGHSPPVLMTINQIGVAHYMHNELDSANYYFLNSLQLNALPDSVNAKIKLHGFVEPFEAILSSYYLMRIKLDEYQQSNISLNDLKSAESYLLLAQALITSGRKAIRLEKDNISFGSAVHDFFEYGINYYWTLYQKTHDQIYVQRSFALSEMAKNQTMQVTLRDLRIKEFAGVTQRVLDREAHVVNTTNNLESQLALELSYGQDADADLVHEYETEWETQETQKENFLDSMKRNLPGYYNLKFNNTLISTAQIQSDLLRTHPERIWIEYFVGDNNIYAHCFWRDKVALLKIGDSKTIRKLSQGLTNSVKFEVADRLKELGLSLNRKLLSPIDSLIANEKGAFTKMVIVPDGFLCYLPFEILQQPSHKGEHYLIENFAVSYGYSSTLLWQEFASEKRFHLNAGDRFLGLAPEYGGDEKAVAALNRTGEEAASAMDELQLSPLQENRGEVERVADFLSRRHIQTTLMLGVDANEHSFKQSPLTDYNIIHMATHGIIDSSDPDRSGIALSRNLSTGEDGILFVREIFNLRTRADLVCLSACDTGFGEVIKGEGIMGMSRAFIYSGTKNMIVSLWSVQDRSTSVLMSDFYKALTQDKSIPESLRLAKLEMLKTPGVQPQQWAGFIHIGI